MAPALVAADTRTASAAPLARQASRPKPLRFRCRSTWRRRRRRNRRDRRRRSLPRSRRKNGCRPDQSHGEEHRRSPHRQRRAGAATAIDEQPLAASPSTPAAMLARHSAASGNNGVPVMSPTRTVSVLPSTPRTEPQAVPVAAELELTGAGGHSLRRAGSGEANAAAGTAHCFTIAGVGGNAACRHQADTVHSSDHSTGCPYRHHSHGDRRSRVGTIRGGGRDAIGRDCSTAGDRRAKSSKIAGGGPPPSVPPTELGASSRKTNARAAEARSVASVKPLAVAANDESKPAIVAARAAPLSAAAHRWSSGDWSSFRRLPKTPPPWHRQALRRDRTRWPECAAPCGCRACRFWRGTSLRRPRRRCPQRTLPPLCRRLRGHSSGSWPPLRSPNHRLRKVPGKAGRTASTAEQASAVIPAAMPSNRGIGRGTAADSACGTNPGWRRPSVLRRR